MSTYKAFDTRDNKIITDRFLKQFFSNKFNGILLCAKIIKEVEYLTKKY